MNIIHKIKKVQFNDKIAVFLSAILAVVVFLALYGPYSLDVCEDSWILTQSFESDTVQNYAGWTQFRISSWKYPLGFADTIAYGDGTYITYTDSIPYVSIFFKLFRDVLPETFQFFGWFTLTCFVLQGIAACLLIKRRFRSYSKILLSEIFFLTAPVLILRAFTHTALGSQWLPLFALYFYLEYRNHKEDKLPWQLVLLSTLTVGIHPYFLPMVMIFVLLTVVEAFIRRYTLWKVIGYASISVAFPYGMGVLIGALGTGIENTRGGYGVAGLDLSTLFNPKGYGGIIWSHILQSDGYPIDMKEGFGYLGMGILAMFAVSALCLTIKIAQDKSYIATVKEVLKKNFFLICAMGFMTIFAISNVVVWNDEVLFRIPLPEKILEYANIFRASARMFWPVYYLLMVTAVYAILSLSKKEISTILLAAFLLLQIWDMRDVYERNYVLMKENYDVNTIMDDETLAEISGKEVMAFFGTENFELQRALAIWAAQHDMGICYSIANTGKYDVCQMYTYTFYDNMNNGLILDEVVYVTLDEDIMQRWREALSEAGREYKEYKRSYYYFVYTE